MLKTKISPTLPLKLAMDLTLILHLPITKLIEIKITLVNGATPTNFIVMESINNILSMPNLTYKNDIGKVYKDKDLLYFV